MHPRGFTLIEMMIVLAIIVIIGTTVTLNLFGNRSHADLTNTAKEIATTLRQAQSDSLSSEQGGAWGVHFDNTSSTQPYYSLVYTSSTNIGGGLTGGSSGSGFVITTVGQYNLPADVCYASSSIAIGSSTNIFFSEVSGAPSATATIVLDLVFGGGCPSVTGGSSSTITRSESGELFFDDFNRTVL